MISEKVLATFGYPATVIKEYERWWLLLAPAQFTLGTLILAAKEGVTSLGELSKESFSDLASVTRDVETKMREIFQVDRFNYLWLMMATKEAHAAIIPRYSSERVFFSMTFTDPGWPKKPDLDFIHKPSPELSAQLVAHLREAFTK